MYEYVLATHGWPKDMECVVLRQSEEHGSERYDYESHKWVRDEESWWRHCMDSNDYENIDDIEARKVIEEHGGVFAS